MRQYKQKTGNRTVMRKLQKQETFALSDRTYGFLNTFPVKWICKMDIWTCRMFGITDERLYEEGS